MSNLEIIETMCNIVEKQNHIIRQQADILGQMGAVCLEEEIQEVNDLVDYFLGRQERDF